MQKYMKESTMRGLKMKEAGGKYFKYLNENSISCTFEQSNILFH
jgi:hypothetical protein